MTLTLYCCASLVSRCADEIVSILFGFGGADSAAATLGELEGSVVELGASSSDLLKRFDDGEEDVEEDVLESALMQAGAEVSR